MKADPLHLAALGEATLLLSRMSTSQLETLVCHLGPLIRGEPMAPRVDPGEAERERLADEAAAIVRGLSPGNADFAVAQLRRFNVKANRRQSSGGPFRLVGT